MIKLKRIYEAPARGDGARILVDRVWPRGVTGRRAALDEWLKDLAPSTSLRQWFAHDPERWPEFRRRYLRELTDRAKPLAALRARARGRTVTLLFGARDKSRNNAVVLKQALERVRKRRKAKPA